VKRGGVRTIFFGGGTPTLLEPRHFDKIINSIICHLTLDICHSEISVEANPGTADKTKLRELRQLGINRLSIGAQSFNDRHLQTLGRIHDAKAIFKFYEDARAAGFDNINLDLIFALPGQTLEEWKTDLQTAISLQPEHISTYNLQIEDGTPFWSQFRNPQSTIRNNGLPDEETELAMNEHTIETLTANGYNHYEISNFAKPGRECQHNLTYWRNENYLGIGAGAHSHVNGRRWSNPNCVEEYLDAVMVKVKKPVSSNGYGYEKTKHLTQLPYRHHNPNPEPIPDTTAQRETLWLGLRLLNGLPAEKFQGFEKEVAELTKNGLLETANGHIKLTRHGLYLANDVFEKFV